eukprot:5371058-Pleurochrysis_carterae.AAC.2
MNTSGLSAASAAVAAAASVLRREAASGGGGGGTCLSLDERRGDGGDEREGLLGAVVEADAQRAVDGGLVGEVGVRGVGGCHAGDNGGGGRLRRSHRRGRRTDGASVRSRAVLAVAA